MGLDEDQLLLARKPLYGIPESGLHWFATYQRHHTEKLDMDACKSDPCVLYKRSEHTEHESEPQAVIILQVDDSHGHGDCNFLECEQRSSSRFECKPRKILQAGDAAQFNGTRINVGENGVHILDQTSKLQNVKVPCTEKELICVRAQIQYVAICTRTDLCAAVQLMAFEVTKAEQNTFKKMKEIVDWCHNTQDVGLKFVPLASESLRLALFTDASFANTAKFKSQIGFVIVLCDHQGNANIVHYGSSSCKRGTRSVMAAELLGLFYGFDNAFLVKHMLSEVLGKEIPLDGYVDSKNVIDIVGKREPIGSYSGEKTSDRRLRVARKLFPRRIATFGMD